MRIAVVVAAGALAAFSLAAHAAEAAPSKPAAAEPYQVEWVYRIKYGFEDEWWTLFRKYQIAILDREKQLGFVTRYIVEAPGLHTDENSRWDYRVVITYPSYEASQNESEVEQQLFGGDADLRKDEDRRWQLTLNHWDLPIHQVDPHQN